MDKERTDMPEIDGQQLHVPAVASSKHSRIIRSDSEKPPTLPRGYTVPKKARHVSW